MVQKWLFCKILFVAFITFALGIAPAFAKGRHPSSKSFRRIATFPVFLNTDIDKETVAEIVDVSKDGKTLVYTDGVGGNLGFVDIKDPENPKPAGVVDMDGEPTSVAVAGNYALVVVNTSPSFVAPSGNLIVVDIKSQTIVVIFALGGQPDAVAVSPDGRYAAIAMENERDEDLGDGAPPQTPGGFLTIVDLIGDPEHWSLRKVNLDGIADLFPNDPEPEYVDINKKNVAVVTLQENNYIVLVDLPSGNIVNHFSAGSVDLENIDTVENDLIELNSSLSAVPREPDGVVWVSSRHFAIANEGDLNGGSRGFTIYDTAGNIISDSGNELEHIAVRIGHYPEDRSENKGNEPENVETGRYGRDRFLFVGSERSSVVFVYQIKRRNAAPEFVQVLPAAVKPEGLKAIPRRRLFVAASEKDDRGDKIRSAITIYKYTGDDEASYPTVISANRDDETPIPWGALSGLAVDLDDSGKAYAIHDSFYEKSRIFEMDIHEEPAVITGEIVLKDDMGKLTAVDAGLVNDDGSVNLDQEGIAIRADGGFWIASEGGGTVGDADRPFKSLNLLLKVAADGVIEQVVTMPGSVNDRQVRFGFEGAASVGSGEEEAVYVAVQRKWQGDPDNYVRIGRYETASGDWTFFFYPIEESASPNGGWVGLSELTALGNDEFAVLERDNQRGPDARIKRIYKFSVAGLTPQADPGADATPSFPVVSKHLARDLMSDLQGTGGFVPEKIEGMAMLPDGSMLVVNDNDGVDGSNGETQLLRFEKLFSGE